jgi:cytokinin dehydrogenase
MARCLVFMLPFLISSFISTAGLPVDPLTQLLQFGGDVAGGRLSVDPSDVHAASRDFGGMSRAEPMAVFRPRGAGDVAGLVRGAYKSAGGLRVSARGHGHSISGQAQAPGGVVVDMSPHGHGAASARERALPVYSPALSGHYVDVWGGELWVDVLNWTLAHGGLAPRSWTDYLYLSVGGTLSNAGISGQAFNHGPQISNVYELDVITGKGDVVTCSETTNPDLFFGALGGLGQFGIITRARIALERAPKRVGTDHCTPFPSSDRFLSFAGNKHDSVFFSSPSSKIDGPPLLRGKRGAGCILPFQRTVRINIFPARYHFPFPPCLVWQPGRGASPTSLSIRAREPGRATGRACSD